MSELINIPSFRAELSDTGVCGAGTLQDPTHYSVFSTSIKFIMHKYVQFPLSRFYIRASYGSGYKV